MKKLVYSALGLALLFASSCKKDSFDAQKELVSGGASGVDTLVGEISVNSTVTRTTYLQGIVYVKPGVTLTINPGVTIKGSLGSGVLDSVHLEVNKGTLVVEKGAKLIANGTPTSPIVWTSPKAAGTRAQGDWGGLVLLGNAPIHTKTGATSNTFEALPSSDPRNSYGGNNAADNSGSVTYNRFEFGGGLVLLVNQEINGVTFCGVGNGTTFHHVEVSQAGDDAFEWFGGTINAHHLLAFNPRDDEFDFDEGYSGNLQFIIGYRVNLNDISGSHAIEADNDANGTNGFPHTTPFIANATLVGPSDTTSGVGPGNYYDGEVFLRRNVRIRLVNSLIIAQKQPYALVTTPTTQPLVASVANLSDSIVIGYNIWQTNSAHAVVKSAIEGNPVNSPVDDVATINKLVGLGNSALAGFNDFKLDGALKPLAGSPALSGGVNLAALGLTQFTGTTQRGAVISTDPWTSTGTWLSIATN